MKTSHFYILTAVILVAILQRATAQVPQLLHYQGRAIVSNTNFEGTGQFKFALVNGAGTLTYWSNDGSSTGGSEPSAGISLPVTKGLYAVLLGDSSLPNMTAVPVTAFANSDVRLRIWFNGGPGFQLVSPDQRFAAVGYAMTAATVDDGAITTDKIAAGAITAAKLAPGAVGWTLTGNSGTTPADFIGTTDNQPLELKVNGARVLRLEPASSPNVVGGYGGNTVSNGVIGATIAGGGALYGANLVGASWAMVGGGSGNTASAQNATVSGGDQNTASGYRTTIGGGALNTASASGGTVGGGVLNTGSGSGATVGGGLNNVASGSDATVPGGEKNTASGELSFAAGRRAKAQHLGAFVWADSTDADFPSVATNEFAIRAAAGVRVVGGGVKASSFSGQWQEVTATTQQADSNKGYLANNASEVTITLPPAPAVGDVVRVSGMGSGGWRIAQNNGQSIRLTGINNVSYTWVAHDSDRDWRGVASSADGNNLAAIVYGGRIYTSADSGVTWIPHGDDRNWRAITSSADGTKLVAVDSPGQIYVSEDSGTNWVARGPSLPWYGVASSSDGNKLVAVGGFNGSIFTSVDSGATWTQVLLPTATRFTAVACSADGSKLAAVSRHSGGGTYGDIFISNDAGANWTSPESMGGDWTGVASSSDGSKLVATRALGAIYSSTDSGISWTERESDRFRSSVACSADGNKIVSVGGGSEDVPDQIYTSADSGFTWVAREGKRKWTGVASSTDGSKLVATVLGGRIFTAVIGTALGTGGELAGAADSAIELQYVGGGQFRVLSYAGTITPY